MLLLAATSLIWGVHWPVTKLGLADAPPFTYGVLRVAGGLACLVVLLLIQGRLRLPPRQDLPIVLSVGLGQMAASIALMNVGLRFVPAGRSAVLVYSSPLWVAGLQALVLRTGLRLREGVGLGLGLAGLAILLNPQAIDWRSGDVVLGSGLLLLSAVIWAATILHLRRHRWTASPLELGPWELLVALVPLVVLALATERSEPVHWEPALVGYLLYSGPLATAFAFWASQWVQRSLSPLASSIGFLAVPVVGLVAGAVMLGEPIGPADLVGLVVALCGIALVSLAPTAQTVPEPQLRPAGPA